MEKAVTFDMEFHKSVFFYRFNSQQLLKLQQGPFEYFILFFFLNKANIIQPQDTDRISVAFPV